MGVSFFGLGGNQEPSLEEVHAQQERRPSSVAALDLARRRKSVADGEVTGASQITARQSIIPVTLVTILFFLWVSSTFNPFDLNLDADFNRDSLMDCWMYSTLDFKLPSTSPRDNPLVFRLLISALTSSAP
jgi:hypothetical protein